MLLSSLSGTTEVGTEARYVRVSVAEPAASGACNANLTELLMPDGSPIDGVRKITLVGEVDCVWIAHIELIITPPPELTAMIADVTSLASVDREYVKVEAQSNG